jgi:hypothetical protein
VDLLLELQGLTRKLWVNQLLFAFSASVFESICPANQLPEGQPTTDCYNITIVEELEAFYFSP